MFFREFYTYLCTVIKLDIEDFDNENRNPDPKIRKKCNQDPTLRKIAIQDILF